MTNNEKNNWTIARVMTRSAWLHVQDALEIGKFRLFLGNYERGQGAKAQATAYVDVDKLRVVFQDLALRGGFPKNLYPKQSVEFFGGSEREGRLEARIVRFSEQPAMKNPIVIEISHGPGKRNRTGGIQPVGKLESVSVLLDRWNARRLAGTVLAELAAWESVTVMSRRGISGVEGKGNFERRDVEDYDNQVHIDGNAALDDSRYEEESESKNSHSKVRRPELEKSSHESRPSKSARSTGESRREEVRDDDYEGNRRSRRRKTLDAVDDRSRNRRRSYSQDGEAQSKSFHKSARSLKALRSKR
jgi:hypothetical protein